MVCAPPVNAGTFLGASCHRRCAATQSTHATSQPTMPHSCQAHVVGEVLRRSRSLRIVILSRWPHWWTFLVERTIETAQMR